MKNPSHFFAKRRKSQRFRILRSSDQTPESFTLLTKYVENHKASAILRIVHASEHVCCGQTNTTLKITITIRDSNIKSFTEVQ